jgi:hypothetical protein
VIEDLAEILADRLDDDGLLFPAGSHLVAAARPAGNGGP